MKVAGAFAGASLTGCNRSDAADHSQSDKEEPHSLLDTGYSGMSRRNLLERFVPNEKPERIVSVAQGFKLT